MLKTILTIFLIILVGCATGDKFSNVEEGMTKKQVRDILGKHDQIQKHSNGATVYLYKNRLISGWSYDKTDYYVVFGPDQKVYVYGHGAIDTRTSDRAAAYSRAYLKAQARRAEAERKSGERNNRQITCYTHGNVTTCN